MASCCACRAEGMAAATSQGTVGRIAIGGPGRGSSAREWASGDALRFAPLRKFERGRTAMSCRASLASDLGAAARTAAVGAAAFGLSAMLVANPAALAGEQNILSAGPPKDGYVVDDASVLNRVTKSELKRVLSDLEANEGYRIDLITLRKLTIKSDAFEFADQVLEKWYPTIQEGDKKGIVLLITTQKEGAVTGGPAFVKAVGEPVLEAVVAENLPVLATDEKYNEAFSSTAKRLVGAIRGVPDVAGPKFQEAKREANFKTKEETEQKRGQFQLAVGGLLVIAFVVPMAQYYAYVAKK